MLHSTFELITLAASNSLVVFCFCNLIIGILLVASSKPNSEVDDEEKHSSHSLSSIAHRDQEISLSLEKNYAGSQAKTEAPLQKNVEAPAEVIETSIVNITVVDDCQESNQDDDEQDDDELRRRVEEFIEKVNRGWKEEKLRTYAYAH